MDYSRSSNRGPTAAAPAVPSGRRATVPWGATVVLNPMANPMSGNAPTPRRAAPRKASNRGRSPLPDSNRRPLPYHRDLGGWWGLELSNEVPANRDDLRTGHDRSVSG